MKHSCIRKGIVFMAFLLGFFVCLFVFSLNVCGPEASRVIKNNVNILTAVFLRLVSLVFLFYFYLFIYFPIDCRFSCTHKAVRV